MNLDLADILKLAGAALLIIAGIWQYRRRSGDPNNSYGSQSGVLLLAIGIILAVVALGGLEYRPSAGELTR